MALTDLNYERLLNVLSQSVMIDRETDMERDADPRKT